MQERLHAAKIRSIFQSAFRGINPLLQRGEVAAGLWFLPHIFFFDAGPNAGGHTSERGVLREKRRRVGQF